MTKSCLSIFAALMLTVTIATPASAETYKWGAIALDTQKADKEPAWGVGGGDTEKDASDTAVKLCKDEGGAVCTAAVTYEQCGALAVDGKGAAGWGKSPTKGGAEKQAIDGCGADSCSVVTSDCNNE
ncbi:MAG: DUF4189 domain-containing protein [Aestuariivirga sp.]